MTEIEVDSVLGLNCSTGFVSYLDWCNSKQFCEGVPVSHPGLCSSADLWVGRACISNKYVESCEENLQDQYGRFCKKVPGKCLITIFCTYSYLPQVIQRCNNKTGLDECGASDFSDEICFKNDELFEEIDNYFLCNTGDEKIHPTNVCNGFTDCKDSSDEASELCKTCPIPDSLLEIQNITIEDSWRYSFPHLKRSASFTCSSREGDSLVCATPGDGNHECTGNFDKTGEWTSQDEQRIEEFWTFVFLGRKFPFLT